MKSGKEQIEQFLFFMLFVSIFSLALIIFTYFDNSDHQSHTDEEQEGEAAQKVPFSLQMKTCFSDLTYVFLFVGTVINVAFLSGPYSSNITAVLTVWNVPEVKE